MSSELTVNCLVKVQNVNLGCGKLLKCTDSKADVLWFTSISNYLENKDKIVSYDIRHIKRVVPCHQTRCYVMKPNGKWQIGRFTKLHDDQTDGLQYFIKFPGQNFDSAVPEKDIFVRCYKPSNDPIDTLIYSGQESPYYYSHKIEYLKSVFSLRASGQGLTGLTSSRIVLFPHQIRVINRILKDPVQRYLLADEVGLGKTIEASVVLRQTLLDRIDSVRSGKFRAILIVPKELKPQWISELTDKFFIVPDQEMIRICDFNEIIDVNLEKQYDICIIDEAHNIARLHQDENIWRVYEDLAASAEKILLLSATPAIRHENEYLAMLSLLDPEHYKLKNIDDFKFGISSRQQIGTFLLGFNIGLIPQTVKVQLTTARQLFTNNQSILDLCNQLDEICTSASPKQQEIDLKINKIRINICETSRLYRRLIRTTRFSLEPSILTNRMESNDKIIQWTDYDDRISQITNYLEEWRNLARIDASNKEEAEREIQITKLSNVFIVLLECFDNSITLLIKAIECRLLIEKANNDKDFAHYLSYDQIAILTEVSHFAEENTLLEFILGELNTVEIKNNRKDKYEELIYILENCIERKIRKSVIFTSSTFTGEEIVNRLRNSDLGLNVIDHLYSSNHKNIPEEFNTYYVDNSSNLPIVLVCDKSGEEGINLQKANLLIHFDLPWNPNRIEQRIGRFDRIGRNVEVSSVIFLPCKRPITDEPDSIPASIPDSWYTILKTGFNIFCDSIADLQFYVNSIMPKIVKTAFMDGVDGLNGLLESIKNEIEVERTIIKEQNFLDSIEAFEEDDRNIIDSTIKFDKEYQSIQQAFESWVVDTLQFNRSEKNRGTNLHSLVYSYGSRDGRLEPSGRPVVQTISFQEANTLMPLDIWAQIRARITKFDVNPIDTDGSFCREQACRVPGMPIFRLGHPFYDFIISNALWDDRGQTYCMWRRSKKAISSERLFFVLDYGIELTLHPQVKPPGMNQHSEIALKRERDSWFPPCFRTICFDQDLDIVRDDTIIKVLTKPYQKLMDGGEDINLVKENMRQVFQLINEDHWSSLCMNVRAKSEQSIRDDPTLIAYCEEKCKYAARNLQIRLERLKYGLSYIKETRIADINQDAIESFIQLEEKIISSIISGIKTPNITLIACGVIILSKEIPEFLRKQLEY